MASSAARAPFTVERLGYITDLLFELVVGDIKLRYKRSVLGIGWSLLNPLAQLLVYQFVFTVIMPTRIDNFGSFLFIGILAFSWFQETLSMATNAIVQNREHINRPGFPAAILPVISAGSQLVHFILALPVLFVVLYLGGAPITMALLILPAVVLLQFIFTLSLSYLAAATYVYFRDIRYLINIFLSLFFFLTPIVYSLDFVPENLVPLYQLNPLMHFIEAYRAILMRGQVPQGWPLIMIGGLTMIFMRLGYRAFMQATYHFVEEA
jgi:lipopolysaccharide transport system permease protein